MTAERHLSTFGALPWRVGQRGEVEFGLVHRARRADWSIPKGGADPGESARACALRELREETGLDAVLGDELPAIRYNDRRGREKIVRYWAARAVGGRFAPNSEIDQFRWVSPISALQLLTHPRERALALILAHRLALRDAGLGAPLTPRRDARRDAPRERATLLLRGGAAIGASEWTGPDSTRPLTEAGRLTASTLTALTSVYEVNSALSATTERSWSTLEPLARSRRLEVDATPMLDEGLPEQNLAVVDAVRGLGAAVCMHESSVRDVISALQQRDGLRVTSPLRVRRGSVWVLTGDERAYRSALYLPLPDADLLGADRATTLATSSAS